MHTTRTTDTDGPVPAIGAPLAIGGRLAGVIAGLAAVPAAAAHTGTTHAGTPHWAILALLLVGIGIVGLARLATQRGRIEARAGAGTILAGVVIGGLGAIGLVEIQVVSRTGPSLGALYPYASLLIGASVMIGGLIVTRLRWPDRPRYAVLPGLLGVWIVYPNVLPDDGVTHPLGYALVLGLPIAVGYVVRRDAGGAIRAALRDRFARTIGLATGAFTTVLVAFSAGTLSVNPDDGIGLPTEPVLTTIPVANPLVTWPAIEFYLPAVPIAGMVSVGTAILFGLLGGLVGTNAAVLTAQWQAGRSVSLRGSLLGSVATTGATACCCCAPAVYGVLSALFGSAVTPIYWAFMDSSSPLGAAFLAASVLLLTASLVHAGGGPGGAMTDPTAEVSL
ncbi:MAG: hypothetical protein ABEJ77_00640 [Halanaeroarchaeum sp.]